MKSTIVRSALALALLVGVLAVSPAVASEGWGEDMDKAMAQAEKEGKDLLIDFTGSDWCGWCIKLEKEVFTQEPFTTEAPKKFVLVKLDFPKRKKLPASMKEQNKQWKDKLGVRGFPTIYLTDAKGKPYAKTGYKPGGPEVYMKHLVAFQQDRIARDKFLAQADKAKGVARAKLLDKAVSTMNPALPMSDYEKKVDEIIALDKDDTAGLKSKYAKKRALAKVDETLAAAMKSGKTDEALKVITDAIKDHDPKGEALQDLLFKKSLVLFRKKDKSAAKAALIAAKAAAPESETGQRIDDILERFFKDVK